MPKIVHEPIEKKTLIVNPRKVKELRQLLGAENDSEAVRQAIDQALAYKKALEAARRIQKRLTFGRSFSK